MNCIEGMCLDRNERRIKMNHMDEVAKILCVELGEEFEIENTVKNPYKLTENGLYDCCDCNRPDMLHNIITGNYEIVKKPWVPEHGGMVWIADNDGEASLFTFESDFAPDVAAFALGWYCLTEEEAEAHAPEIREQMRRILAGELRAELVGVE